MNTKITRVIQWMLLLSLTVPLWYTPFTFFPNHFGKTVIWCALVAVIAFLALFQSKSLFVIPERSPAVWLDYAVIIFIGTLVLTSITGQNPGASFWGNLSRAQGVVVWCYAGIWYLLVRRYADEQWCNRAMYTSVFVGLVATFTALWPQLMPATMQPLDASRASGILGNPAFYGNYIILPIAMAVLLAYKRQKFERWFFAVAAVFLTIGLAASGTRGAALGLAAGACVFILFAALSRFKKPGRAILVAAVAVVVLLGSSFIFLRTTWASAHLAPLARLTNISALTEGTGETRLMAWKIALQGFLARPVFGYGPGLYENAYSQFYNPRFLAFGTGETVWDKPHNWPLEIAATSGIVGLVSYGAIIVIAAFLLVRKTLPGNERSVLLAGLGAAFVASIFLFETSNSLVVWMLLLALIAAKANANAEAPAPTRRTLTAIYKFFVGIALFSTSVILILSLSSAGAVRSAHNAITYSAWKNFTDRALEAQSPVTSDAAIFLAERFVQLDKSGVTADRDNTKSTAEKLMTVLESTYAKHPNTPIPLVWAGQIGMVYGEYGDQALLERAIKDLTSATDVSPQKQDQLLLLARAHALNKDIPKAIAVANRAVQADPAIGQPHWFLGLLLVAAGDTPGGIAEIERSETGRFSLSQNEVLYLINLYAGQKQYAKIIERYKILIKNDPGNVQWYASLAAAYAANGDKQNALETVEYAANMYPPFRPEAEKFIKENHLR